MFGIFLTKQGFVCRNAPVNTQRIIKDGDATISLWMIEFITLILEDCGLCKNGKAMCKATRHEELETYGRIEH